MRKPDSLRAALVAAIPGLNTDPEKFLVFLKAGTIASRWTPGAPVAAEYRYTLTVGLIDFVGDPDDVFLAIVSWVGREQPDLLQRSCDGDGMTFSADILGPDSVDLSIELRLTEAVTTSANGRVHAAEPGPDFFGLTAAAGPDVVPPPPLVDAETRYGDASG